MAHHGLGALSAKPKLGKFFIYSKMSEIQPAESLNAARAAERRDIGKYLRGEKLYGDDFTPEQIDAWFRDEELGYFNLGASDKARYEYGYHALNDQHGYRHLPDRAYPSVLGVGSAYGEELKPVARRANRITILEPAEGFVVREINGVPVNYAKPQASGILPFPDESFDLITCFGVLHHVPNVSTVVREFHRCLNRGGYALVREPIVSMGDWRKPRVGLTRHERGIPLDIFRKIVLAAGFKIARESKCVFSLTSRLRFLLSGPVYNSRLAVRVDSLLCRLPLWSDNYHPAGFLQKIRPTAVFYVLEKT